MDRLKQLLSSIDGKGYKAYKQLEGDYFFPDFTLRIDHVQGDPFADPSRCRLFINYDKVQPPHDLYTLHQRKIALQDFLGRSFTKAIGEHVQGDRGSGRSGQMHIVQYGQQVLERNALLVSDSGIEVRIQLALPANKRTIVAKQALIMLLDELPKVVQDGLAPLINDIPTVKQFVDTVANQQYLRQQLTANKLVCFIADDSLLPRRSGVDDRPLSNGIVTKAPDSLAITLEQIDGTSVRGLGIKKGITLVVGGGFHGKSTLLQAIELGVYNHIMGDGRERVVTLDSAVKIRAEDRRSICNVDISPFISDLPQGKKTTHFSTQDASGSTSQAANIIEALSTWSQLLLVDEDTSATNFMIRDERMQALVAKDKEPITPLQQRITDLRDENQVSVILVMGGSGDFFSCADTVLMMDSYQIRDVTEQAKTLAKPLITSQITPQAITPSHQRYLDVTSLNPKSDFNKEKLQAIKTRILRYGRSEIDVSNISQLVDETQLNAIAYLLRYVFLHAETFNTDKNDINLVFKLLLDKVKRDGMDCLTPYVVGTLAMPRLYEVVATINRMRQLRLH